MFNEIILNKIGALRPADVCAYDQRKGWNRVDVKSSTFIVLHSTNNDEMTVPLRSDFGDYKRRMFEAIQVISESERRSPIQVLHDLQFFGSDIIRFRLDAPNTAAGTIPLAEGADFILGMRRTLQVAVCDAQTPQKFHERVDTKESKEIVSQCSLGQTEEGSYIASLVCPVSSTSPYFFPQPQTATAVRKVTSHVMCAFGHIENRLRESDLKRLIEPDFEKSDPLISSNFYQAIVLMEPDSEKGALEVHASWSQAIEEQPNVKQSSRLIKSDFAILKDVVEQLRPKIESKYSKYVGKVYSLQGEEGDLGLPLGSITVQVTHENVLVRAVVDLEQDDYARACDAHKMGQYISLTGVFETSHRRSRIDDYSDFTILA